MNQTIEVTAPVAMSGIVYKTLENAQKQLRAVGAQFIIVMPGAPDIIEGDLRLAAPVKPKRENMKGHPTHPRGYLKSLYDKQIEGMVVGDVVTIMAPEGVPVRQLRGGISGHINLLWGKGNGTTCFTADESGIEVLRMG